MAMYEVQSFSGGLSDFTDRGIRGSFKFGANLSVRRSIDSLTCGQALIDEGLSEYSQSPSASVSPSASISKSISPSASASPSSISVSRSPSTSVSASQSASTGISPSVSLSVSLSLSLSPSTTSSVSVSPSPSPSGGAGVTTVFQDLVRFFVKCTDGFTYGFGSTGYVYRRDDSSGWIRVYKDPDGEIKGATEWPSITGETFLYWATARKLHRKRIPGLANWNDVDQGGTGTWPKTDLMDATWHTMRECGGSLIIANGPYLALVGYDQSYTREALDLIPGNVATTIVERNGRTIAGTSRISDPTKSINAAIDCEVPLAQVGDDGQIYFANMTDSIPVKQFPGGGKSNPGGVCNSVTPVTFFEWEQTALNWIDKQDVGNLALFGVYNATTGKNGIYSYGRTDKNKPFILNLDYELQVDEIGAIVMVDGLLLIAYRDGSNFGVKAVDSTTKATGIYEGLDFKAPAKIPAKITVWDNVELYMKPLPAGTSVEFYYKMDRDGDYVRARTLDGELRFEKTGGDKAQFSIVAQGEIFEHKIVLNPSFNVAPEIYRERVFFN